jgi:DeoR/GlpR family transcriptional regulator of sugar metabolism
VVADHTKWGVRGLSSIAELSAADTIVSDSGLSPQARAAIVDEGIELILASVRPSQRRVTVSGEET